jgi:hypothetical protein
MPKIESWDKFPPGIRTHLVKRMRGRAISISDLNQLRNSKDFLLRGQAAKGEAI